VPVDLKIIPLFRGVQDDALRALSARVVSRTLAKESVIFKEGDVPDALYIVMSGRVNVYLLDEHGKELVLATKGPGEYFGEMMLDDKPRSASVVTVEPSEFAVLSRAQFTSFMLEHPEIALQLIRDLIRLGRGMNIKARAGFRRHIEELERVQVSEIASVKRWRLAKSVVLVLVLILASLQFYYFAAH
jgi:CRP-like cAMP-binding protein